MEGEAEAAKPAASAEQLLKTIRGTFLSLCVYICVFVECI